MGVSRKQHENKTAGDALSPIERLQSGKCGPLPLDNRPLGQLERQEDIDGETQRSAPEENSERRMDDPLYQEILDAYPDLTVSTLERMLAET